jgi:hypothetical protein
MNNSYLAEKFNHRQDVIDAINLLESNNFEIDLGFGGEYTWKTSHSISPEYAGKVYKAFWNIQWAIKKQKGIEVDFSIFFYNN